ncbi:MAG: CehA/McbA family metallohydrolase domain-containing protein [Armatimonadota bacterium]
MSWQNPYARCEGHWLRGNLHTHTSPASGCGQVSIERTLDLYVQAGYDFLAISDHMVLNQVSDDRLTIIPGVEWNSPAGEHVGVYGTTDEVLTQICGINAHADLLAYLAGTDAVVVLNHPNWQLRPHYRREELLQAEPYDGIEIFNGVIRRLDGYEIATDKWDYLLAQGRRVLGFATDDAHIESDIAVAHIAVRATSSAPEDILAAIKTGNFYCSSGAEITDIRLDGNFITIDTPDAQEIQAIGLGGPLLQLGHETSMQFDLRTLYGPYVRFVVYGRGSAMAWTQPFFMS